MTEPVKEEPEKVVVKEEPAPERVIDLPIDTEEEDEKKHPFEVKPALEEDFDKEEEEPAFEVSNDTKEEDQAYRGDVSQPYNPRLDLEFYRFPTLDLLNRYQNDEPDIDMEEQNANKNRIIKVLRDTVEHGKRQNECKRGCVSQAAACAWRR